MADFTIEDWREDRIAGGKFVQHGNETFGTASEAHQRLAELKAAGEVSPKGIVVLRASEARVES